MTEIEHLPSDRALLAATRDGSDAAWSELCARHLPALDAMARADGRGARRDAERALGLLHDELTGTPEAPGPPALAVRAVRPLAISLITGGSYGPTLRRGDDTPTDDGSTPEPPGSADVAELDDLAVAFAGLPDRWQTVLWHRLVEDAPAVTVATLLGCSAADVGQIEQTARRGLFDDYIGTVLAGTSTLDPACRSVLPLLGAHRRGTLPAAQDHRVFEHVTGRVMPVAAARPNRPTVPSPAIDTVAPSGCVACQRRLTLPDRFADLVPAAIVPGLTGLDVARYRSVVGAGAAALGVSAVAARRSDRSSRFARAAGVAAVVFAVLAAAFFIRTPFGDLDSDYADLLDRAATTSSTAPDDSPMPTPALANRIELAFPGARQGAVYVPGGRALSISMSLSTPAPVFAGANGTIDVALTNDDSEDVSFRFGIRTSPGVTFDELSEGGGTCGVETTGPTCDVRLEAGASTTLSLLFSLDVDVSDRLVVASNFAPEPLDVPVEFVPDLVAGRVGRSDLRVIGDTLTSCSGSTCADGHDESSSTLELDRAETIERALLVWEGPAESSWASGVDLIGPGMRDAVSVVPATDDRAGLMAPRGSNATFRSVADVTELVSAAGPGVYTVLPSTSSDKGAGSWTLLVEVAAPSAPRRLVVALAPAVVGSGGSVTADVPISGSTEPRTAERPAILEVQGIDEGGRPPRVSVGVLDLAIGLVPGSGGDGVPSYRLEIPSASETVSVEASPISGSARLGSIGLVIDVVS